jgi:hypothetical protein
MQALLTKQFCFDGVCEKLFGARGFMLLLLRTAGAYASWLGEFEGC